MVTKHTVVCDCEEYYFQSNEWSQSELYNEVILTGWVDANQPTKSAATYSSNSLAFANIVP